MHSLELVSNDGRAKQHRVPYDGGSEEHVNNRTVHDHEHLTCSPACAPKARAAMPMKP